MGKVFDGAWQKLALSARGSQLTVLVDCQLAGTAPVSHYRARRADRDGALEVSPGQRYFLGNHQGLIVYVELHLTLAANNFGRVL